MSATFFDPAHSAERTPPTTDLESTTDLQGHTTDLSPVTRDIEPPEEIDAASPSEIVRSAKLERVGQTPLAPGKVLCDRFILERIVGSGGTAVVYQARDMSATNVRIALKVPRTDRGDRQRAAMRLNHEFAQASKLAHPSIVRVFDLVEHEGTCFMTMELIEGRLLSTIVRDWTMLPRALARSARSSKRR